MDITQVGVLFVVAAFSGIVAMKLKQPLFIGYLFAGLFLKLSGVLGEETSFETLGKIGITLLLFLLGLEMNLRDIHSVGRPALVTGLGQMVVSFTLGYFFASLLGFTGMAPFYVAAAASFSSTIIAVKLISERDDLESLYGRLSVGVLLIQDLIAVLILLVLGGLGQNHSSSGDLGLTLFKGAVLIIIVWLLSKKALPYFFEKISQASGELLFIVSVSWALGFSAFVAKYTGFTLEVGGLLAGLALSGLPEHLQIAVKAKPLRDFFLTIYFLVLGTSLVVTEGSSSIIFLSLVLSAFVVVVHILSVLALLGFQGFKKRTSFFAAMSISQMSEFSLIIASIGVALGHITGVETAIITTTAVITMSFSSYLISNAEGLYDMFKDKLGLFERKNTGSERIETSSKYKDHIILVGCDRTGKQLVKYFEKQKKNYVVIDFNPKVVKELKEAGRPVVFGDVNDNEIMEVSNVAESKLVILTTSNLADNLTFLEYIRHMKPKPTTIFTSSTKSDALNLYKEGASYVVVPGIIAGEYIKHILKRSRLIEKLGSAHFKHLEFI